MDMRFASMRAFFDKIASRDALIPGKLSSLQFMIPTTRSKAYENNAAVVPCMISYPRGGPEVIANALLTLAIRFD